MRTSGWRSVLLALTFALICTPAFAQGGGSGISLSGTVVDKDGGVIPGASVVVKNKATGETQTLVTNSEGSYSIPGMAAGTYIVTVSLQGFKTMVHDDVRLLAATSNTLKTTLQIGQLSETISVKANTELVRTQQTSVTTSMSTEAIQNLPIVIRNALNFVTFLPGVETVGTARTSTIMGLPQSAINLSIDGSSVSNALQSGDGFYAQIFPKLDAIEEVTMTGAGTDAMGASQGTIQVKFVTRSGTNVFKGSGYEYMRRKSFNTNYFFNIVNGLDRNNVNIDQFGGTVGGPIVIPGLIDGRGKAFFFFNMEEFHLPNELTTTRTILTPEAQQGIFRYNTSGGIVSVDLLSTMGGTMDSTMSAMLAKIRQATTTTGVVLVPANQTTINTLNYQYQAPGTRIELTPTQKVDFNLSSKNRLSGTYYWQRITYHPDLLNSSQSRFPGFKNQGYQDSFRTTGSITLRSTLGGGMVNEAIGAWQWSPVQFNPQISAADFDDEAGFAVTFPPNGNNAFWTSPFVTRNQAPRNTPTWNLDENFSWLKGNHSLTFGGSYTQIHNIQNSLDVVPGITLGFDTTSDPTRNLFCSTAGCPFTGGASGGTLTEARALYALLTGRVNSINGTARLAANGVDYVYNGNLHQESKMGEFGAYAQDSYKISPTLTLNYGVRWEVLVPFTTVTENWTKSTIEDLCGPSGLGNGPHGRECNMFKPGDIKNPTQVPTYTVFKPGTPGYQMNYKNLAPNIGVAWRPNVQGGFMRKILGDPEQVVLRGAYSHSFNRPRMDEFTGLFGGNPGGTAPGGAVRGLNAGNFSLYDGGNIPILLSETNRLGPPAFVQTATYPITASLTSGNDINVFTQDIKIPYVKTWSMGISRPIGRDTVVDLRYTGNQAKNSWDTENYNQVNIVENGFLEEFKLAQQNLQANVASGDPTRAGSFKYFGAGTGTSPLPTYLAYFVANAGDPNLVASYSATTNWTSSTFVNRLNMYNPSPYNAANDLWTGSNGTFRTNAATNGKPSNFFVLNPLVDAANVTRNVEGSYYHSFTLEARRRLAHGLLVQGSYVYAKRWAATTQQGDLHRGFDFFRSTTQTPPHTYKLLWTYQLPFGRGQRWGTNMGRLVDGFAGGWEWSGTARVQRNAVRFRGKIVGMSVQDLQNSFKIRYSTDNTGRTTVFSLPQDIIDETRKAYDTSATSVNGYGSNGAPSNRYLAPAAGPGCVYLFVGDCGEQEVFLNLPLFSRFDMTMKKKFDVTKRTTFSIQFDVLNVFDNVNFNHNFNPGFANGNNTFQVTSAYTDPNGTYDPGGRLGQVVFRFNW